MRFKLGPSVAEAAARKFRSKEGTHGRMKKFFGELFSS